MTACSFLSWTVDALSGDSFVYHTGHLAADRAEKSHTGRAVNQDATLAADLFERGVAALSQRRVGDATEYRVTIR